MADQVGSGLVRCSGRSPCVDFENESRLGDEITLLRIIGAPLTAARAVQPVRISCLWIFLDLPVHASAHAAFQLFERFELSPIHHGEV
jgi:hypothetical protein